MTPGELIRSVRRRRGLTQAELAAAGGDVATGRVRVRARPPRPDGRHAAQARRGGRREACDSTRGRCRICRPAADLEEHARRLLDVLSVADAIPHRPAQSRPARARARLVVSARCRSPSGSSRSTPRSSAIPHAFGGALALAYYAEPRATIDIDLNVFVPTDQFPAVAAPLVALGAAADDPAVADQIRRAGQARVMWDDTPDRSLLRVRRVPRRRGRRPRASCRSPIGEIPILAVEHLVVCKAVFDRRKDWVDIDAIVAADTPVDVAEVLRWVGRIAGDEDPRYNRVAAVLAGRAPAPRRSISRFRYSTFSYDQQPRRFGIRSPVRISAS